MQNIILVHYYVFMYFLLLPVSLICKWADALFDIFPSYIGLLEHYSLITVVYLSKRKSK